MTSSDLEAQVASFGHTGIGLGGVPDSVTTVEILNTVVLWCTSAFIAGWQAGRVLNDGVSWYAKLVLVMAAGAEGVAMWLLLQAMKVGGSALWPTVS